MYCVLSVYQEKPSRAASECLWLPIQKKLFIPHPPPDLRAY
jgi:hypothetical protein